jgi:hypothetical protein
MERDWGAFAGKGLGVAGMGAFAGKGLRVGGKGAFAGKGLGVGGMGAGRSSSSKSSHSSKSQSNCTMWLTAGLGSVAVAASSFFIWRLPVTCAP